jgi:hypothetical protein
VSNELREQFAGYKRMRKQHQKQLLSVRYSFIDVFSSIIFISKSCAFNLINKEMILAFNQMKIEDNSAAK